jgi:pyruvate dehydrogenase kinase 2/3/4
VSELKRDLSERAVLTEMPEIHQFLDGFYLSRIGIRILIGQHIALHEPPKPNHIGLVCVKCSPWQVRGRGAVLGAGPDSLWRPRWLPPCACLLTLHSQHTQHSHARHITSPQQVAQDAINDARSICMREYGSAPDVSIYGDPSFTFAYVPSHLHHMIFELVKNSLRAVQDRFEDADDEPPPIRCVSCGCVRWVLAGVVGRLACRTPRGPWHGGERGAWPTT